MFRIVVSGKSKKGDRNHFEDFTLGKFEGNDILAVFDGHCGREAAVYARMCYFYKKFFRPSSC